MYNLKKLPVLLKKVISKTREKFDSIQAKIKKVIVH